MARKMKDSGIEWIGEIPEGWEITKIKHIVSSVTDIDHFMPDSAEFGIPYLMIGDLKDLSSSIDWDSSKKISIEDYKKLSIKSRPQIGDIIFARYASIGTTCYIDTDRDFLVSYACLTIHPSDLIIGKFLSYYLKSSSFAEDVLRRTNSNTQGNVGKDSLVNATIVLPSIIEQTQIVNFLDAKCSDINAMLSKTRASIEEYKKLKQSVITQAVTKTIYDDFGNPFKFRKLRSLCDVLSKGTTPKDIETQNDEFYCIRYLKSENIVSNQLNLNPTFFITAETNNSLERSKLNSGDILFVIAGASIGKVAITTADFLPANTNQAVAFIRLSSSYQYAAKYIWYFLQSDVVKQLIALSAVQSAQPNLSLEDLGAMRLPLPDQMGCLKITDCLDAKCAEIDKLIAKKEQLVKELESYKKSLIYEVVTGKREV